MADALRARAVRRAFLAAAAERPMTDAGIFLTHLRSPRIRRHFERLVAESGPLVRWHFVFSQDAGARPTTPFASDDPADVLAARYRAMERHGGVQGGYLDTLMLPLLRALRARPPVGLRVRRRLRRAVGRVVRAASPTTTPTC